MFRRVLITAILVCTIVPSAQAKKPHVKNKAKDAYVLVAQDTVLAILYAQCDIAADSAKSQPDSLLRWGLDEGNALSSIENRYHSLLRATPGLRESIVRDVQERFVLRLWKLRSQYETYRTSQPYSAALDDEVRARREAYQNLLVELGVQNEEGKP